MVEGDDGCDGNHAAYLCPSIISHDTPPRFDLILGAGKMTVVVLRVCVSVRVTVIADVDVLLLLEAEEIVSGVTARDAPVAHVAGITLTIPPNAPTPQRLSTDGVCAPTIIKKTGREK